MIRSKEEIEAHVRDRIEILENLPKHDIPERFRSRKDARLRELQALIVWLYEEK